MTKIGTIIIPDRSNGPKSVKQPKDCHCHCPLIIVGYDGDALQVAPCFHSGKGGWWKDQDCKICKS